MPPLSEEGVGAKYRFTLVRPLICQSHLSVCPSVGFFCVALNSESIIARMMKLSDGGGVIALFQQKMTFVDLCRALLKKYNH